MIPGTWMPNFWSAVEPQHRIKLVGPVLSDNSWQVKAGKGFDLAHFQIDVSFRQSDQRRPGLPARTRRAFAPSRSTRSGERTSRGSRGLVCVGFWAETAVHARALFSSMDICTVVSSPVVVGMRRSLPIGPLPSPADAIHPSVSLPSVPQWVSHHDPADTAARLPGGRCN